MIPQQNAGLGQRHWLMQNKCCTYWLVVARQSCLMPERSAGRKYGFLCTCVSRGSLGEGHCLIVPSEHVASTRQVDEAVWTELRNFKKCLLQMAMAQVRAAGAAGRSHASLAQTQLSAAGRGAEPRLDYLPCCKFDGPMSGPCRCSCCAGNMCTVCTG